MNSISEKIKYFRSLKGFKNYRELAKACVGVSQEYLYLIEKGETTNVGLDKLESIAKALGITILDLLSDVDSKKQRPTNAIDAPRYTPYDIPVVGLAKAGRGGFFGDDGLPANEWSRKIHRPEDVKDPHAYAVEIDGDSMEPLARKGDHFLCETDKKARNGDLVVVQTHNDEVMAKLFFDDGKHIVLKSMNSNYEPIVLAHDQIRAIHVVKWVKKK